MEIKIFKYGTPEYKAALELRTRILRTPLGLRFTEEDLKKDEMDIHFGLFEDNKIIASLTLADSGNQRLRMRLVAVEENRQGQGLGQKLVAAAEKYAKESGFKVMYCHARKTAMPFYQKLGYKIIGDEFTQVTIPHFIMEKQLE